VRRWQWLAIGLGVLLMALLALAGGGSGASRAGCATTLLDPLTGPPTAQASSRRPRVLDERFATAPVVAADA
jgi:hypothetical protein